MQAKIEGIDNEKLIRVRSDDGTRLAMWRSGEGPPLMLVHGTTVNHADWVSVLPALREQFTVYALDMYLRVVPAFGDFVPAGPEGLYQELLNAARGGHILGSATITGYYAAVKPNSD